MKKITFCNQKTGEACIDVTAPLTAAEHRDRNNLGDSTPLREKAAKTAKIHREGWAL